MSYKHGSGDLNIVISIIYSIMWLFHGYRVRCASQTGLVRRVAALGGDGAFAC